MKDRAAELFSLAKANGADGNARELCENLAFLEEQMQQLRLLPFLKIDAKNPERQKATPAAKQYKDLLQQYNNSLKLFLKMCGELAEQEEESPLRKWVREQSKSKSEEKDGKRNDDLDAGQ